MEQIKLENYGIFYLTGEACKYYLRGLCDYSEKGKSLLEQFFGMAITPTEPWNTKTGTEVHVGSIMLGHNTLKDIRLFASVKNFTWTILATNGTTYGMSDEEYQKLRTVDWFVKLTERTFFNSDTSSCDRNAHAMSGRTY